MVPQALDETLRQVLGVLDIDEHCPAIEAVVLQVLVKLGITQGNEVTSKQWFWICRFDSGHCVVVMKGA